LSLPVWAVAVIAALAVVVGGLALMRGGGGDGRSAPAVGVLLVLIFGFGGSWALDRLAASDQAAERRALDARAFELAARALVPGSGLACLDGIAGETMMEACEGSLFASPEAVAAAVSYVSAQLSLLALGRERVGNGDTSAMTLNLRRAVEADRFGIVAHVLAVRDGCTPNQCSAFILLRDASRVSANLVDRPFEGRLQSRMAAWPPPGSQAVASNPPGATAPPAAVAVAKQPNNLYFPSSASIPPVNIMTAEPATSAAASAGQPPHDTTGAAEPAPPPTPARKPQQGAQQARQPPAPGSAPTRPAPLQIAPSAQ
jgi:hypothetical protein